MADNGLLGSGLLFINKRNSSGVLQGYQFLGNTTKFGITPTGESIVRKSKQVGSYGNALDVVSKPGEMNLQIVLDTLDGANLALAFLGTDAAHSITGTTVTDEAITAPAVLGNMIQVAKPYNISAVTLTSSPAGTTFSGTTDYTIYNARQGLIQILSTGTITASQSLLIDYTYASETGRAVTAGSVTEIDVDFILDLQNLATSKYAKISGRAVLRPTTEVDFLADGFATVTLDGTIIGQPVITWKD